MGDRPQAKVPEWYEHRSTVYPDGLYISAVGEGDSKIEAEIFNGIEKLLLVNHDSTSCTLFIENIITQKNCTLVFQKDNPAFLKMHVYLNEEYIGIYNPLNDGWHYLTVMFVKSGIQIEYIKEISKKISSFINSTYKKISVNYLNPTRMSW